jgi:HSP20 family protein
MSLLKRNEWPSFEGSLLSNFIDDDRFFGSPWLRGQSMPAINVKESEKDIQLEVAVPGYNKKDFNVGLDNGVLTISAEHNQEFEKQEDSYTRKEFGYSSFSRSFRLPDYIDQEKIDANYVDGVLRLKLQKTENARQKPAKTISIK